MKSWPYYKDRVTIFGKDRATGEHAISLADAVDELIRKDKGVTNTPKHVVAKCITEDVSNHDGYTPFANDNLSGHDSDFMFVYHGESASSPGTKKKTSKKRTTVDVDLDAEFTEFIKTFCNQVNDKLEHIAKQIGF